MNKKRKTFLLVFVGLAIIMIVIINLIIRVYENEVFTEPVPFKQEEAKVTETEAKYEPLELEEEEEEEFIGDEPFLID